MEIKFLVNNNAGICKDQVLQPEEIIIKVKVGQDSIHRLNGNLEAVKTRCRIALANSLGCENEDVELLDCKD